MARLGTSELERRLEAAAVAHSMAQGDMEAAGAIAAAELSRTERAVFDEALRLRSEGSADQAVAVVSAAADHAMFRGSDAQPWDRFLGAVQQELQSPRAAPVRPEARSTNRSQLLGVVGVLAVLLLGFLTVRWVTGAFLNQDEAALGLQSETARPSSSTTVLDVQPDGPSVNFVPHEWNTLSSGEVSPNGEQVAFQQQGEVCIADLHGSGPPRCVAGLGAVSSVGWTPDGRFVTVGPDTSQGTLRDVFLVDRSGVVVRVGDTALESEELNSSDRPYPYLEFGPAPISGDRILMVRLISGPSERVVEVGPQGFERSVASLPEEGMRFFGRLVGRGDGVVAPLFREGVGVPTTWWFNGQSGQWTELPSVWSDRSAVPVPSGGVNTDVVIVADEFSFSDRGRGAFKENEPIMQLVRLGADTSVPVWRPDHRPFGAALSSGGLKLAVVWEWIGWKAGDEASRYRVTFNDVDEVLGERADWVDIALPEAANAENVRGTLFGEQRMRLLDDGSLALVVSDGAWIVIEP